MEYHSIKIVLEGEMVMQYTIVEKNLKQVFESREGKICGSPLNFDLPTSAPG